jgi:hypothetical protein
MRFNVDVWKVDKRPSKWDPTNSDIAKVLSTYEEKFISEFPDGVSPGIADSRKGADSVKEYCDNKPDWWKQKYPIIVAISENNTKKLKDHTKECININIQLEDLGNLTYG